MRDRVGGGADSTFRPCQAGTRIAPSIEPRSRTSLVVREARRFGAWALALVLLATIPAVSARSEPASREQMRGLDEQVQEIKSEVLEIAAELSRLEERLLYPSDTHVAVFVSLSDGGPFRLDSVQVEIDGMPVARHIYSFKELEALRKGGVQRIYTGNLATGEHQLAVSVAGARADGAALSSSESFVFTKDVGPELVGISLVGGDSGAPDIRMEGW